MVNSTTPQEQNPMQHGFYPELAAYGRLPSVRLVHGIVFGSLAALAQRTRPAEVTAQEGAQRAVACLREFGYALQDDIWRSVIDAFEFAEQKSAEEKEEHLADDVLRFLLQFQNLGTLDQSAIKRAVDEYYLPEIKAWQMIPEAHSVLATLREAGYRIGIVENHACDRAFQQTVDRLGLRQLLDLSITSAAVEYRKPDRHIYEVALKAWDILPYELVVAGVHPINDIAPAIELGALSIFIRQAANAQSAGGLYSRNDIRFDADVNELGEIPDLMMKWAQS